MDFYLVAAIIVYVLIGRWRYHRLEKRIEKLERRTLSGGGGTWIAKDDSRRIDASVIGGGGVGSGQIKIQPEK